MSARRVSFRWPWWTAAAVVGAASQVQAQKVRPPEEPAWLRMNVREVSTGIYSEGTFDTTAVKGSESTVTYERVFIGPLIGLNLDGSVYHPNLIRYSLLLDGSVGWGFQNTTSSTTTEHRNELEYLGRFNCTTTILQKKPYATTIFGDLDHTYRDYDFFSRVIVDSWRYGFNTGYSEGPVPVHVSYWHRDEEISGYAAPTSTREDVLTVQADNNRDSGASSFQYSFNQYGSRAVADTTSGSDNTVNLSDTERFGNRKQYELTATAGLSHRESDLQPSDEVTGSANFKAEYTPTLSSWCNVSYDNYSTGLFDSDSLIGHAELRHQLYDSLTSSLIAEGSDYRSSDDLNTAETSRYGVGFGESYTKRLSETSRLQCDNTLMVSHSDVFNSGGIGTVYDERHSFAGGGAAPSDTFFLNQSRVIESTIVLNGDLSDPNGPYFPYQEGLDYTVRRNGVLTLVERIPGSRIPRNQTVLVDYTYLASPSGSYNTLNESFHIRFSLWDNLWGLYGRLNVVANDAPPELLVEDLNIYTMGTDVSWRSLRAGAEYEIYDSSMSDYRTTRLFQSLALRPDDASSLSFDLTQSWTDYVSSQTTESRYTFITHYHRTLSWRFGADVDGGVSLRRNAGVDQTLATCRPGIQYSYGKTSIKASYDFEYELYRNSEERTKHMFFVRIKRVF